MTLTQTAILTKQVIVISATALVLGTAGLVGYNIWHAYYLANLPPVEEKPDLKFGLLPSPDFPDSSVSSSNFSYSLDTVTGGLPKIGKDPEFEKIIKVYFIPQTFATLLSPDRSASLAEKFGITTLAEYLSETEYQFKDKRKNLLVNLDTGNFSYRNDSSVSAKEVPDEDNKLVSEFKEKLSLLEVLRDDLKNGRSKVIPLENGKIQISLWPKALDKKELFSQNLNKAPIYAVVAGSGSSLENYYELDFTYYPIDTSTFATYPLKSPEKAFADLKNGRGIVIIEPSVPQVSITSVSIGYYLPKKYSPYLQPIFIFEGPSLAAYVSAISEDFQVKATAN